jgi:hypothetical protein
MKTLKAKIRKLLAMNDIELVYTWGSDDPNSIDKVMKRQEQLQEEIDELARANDTILGRQIKFPMGDGYAYYVITKVNKRSVEITWVKYCDAWQDSRAGYQSLLDFDYANQQVRGQDKLAEMFSKKPTRKLNSLETHDNENEVEVDCE